MHSASLPLTPAETPSRRLKARKSLLWLGIISITMLFAALTSAYIVRQGEGKWAEFHLPTVFIFSTVTIFLSSFPMQWALVAARKGRQAQLRTGLILTAVLGIVFVGLQYAAWSELFGQGIAFAGQIGDIKGDYTYVRAGSESASDIATTGNVAGSFLYVITALHVLHLVAGILVLFVVLSRALKGRYTPAAHSGVSLCATYWHFLDGLWVYLFFFLLYIR
jgi:cytochrome c oxidase subunit 3